MTYASKTETTQAHWEPQQALDEKRLSRSLRSLLTEAGSLTERLREGCKEGLTVRVLRQERCRPADFPEHLLRSSCSEAMLREVYLQCDGRPVVFAQTLVPDATLAVHPWLAELGDQPLGHALFARRDVTRLPFEFAELGQEHGLVESAFTALEKGQIPCAGLWARRSQFMVGGMPVSVNEVFFLNVAALVE